MRKQYGWGVRGWGASQNNPMSALIKSSSLYLSADKADGQPFVKLEPRTLNNGVSNGEYTPQNVSGDVVITDSMISNFATFPSNTNLVDIKLPLNSVAITDTSVGVALVDGIAETSSANFNNVNFVYRFYPSVSNTGVLRVILPKTVLNLTQAREFISGRITRYQLATPIDTLNVPFKNPWTDLKGVVGKNLFSAFDLIGKANNTNIFRTSVDGREVLAITGSVGINGFVVKNDFKPNTRYTLSSFARRLLAGSSGGLFVFEYTDGTTLLAILPSDDLWRSYTTVTALGKSIKELRLSFGTSSTNYYDINTLQLEEGSTATAYEPYGKANCLLQAFAGTTADGYTVETINGKTNTFVNLDGLNSFGQFANMDVLNPVGTDDFCQMVVFRPDDNITRYFGLGRNSDGGTATHQYGFVTSVAVNTSRVIINGVADDIAYGYNLDLKYFLYGRISGRKFIIHNGLEVLDAEYTTSIATRPNTQLACRSVSADGLTKSSFAKGLQGDIAFWKGAQGTLDKDKIVDLVRKAMKQKYNLGV